MSGKIAILSMQKVINYGSFLQAYGLKKILQMICSYEINFIDIIPGRYLESNKVIPYRKKIDSVFKSIRNGLFFEKIKDHLYMKMLKHQFKKVFFLY